MTQKQSKSPALFVALWMSLGLVMTGCGEEAAESTGAPADDGMAMDGVEDKLKDGIDPETGNPPEL